MPSHFQNQRWNIVSCTLINSSEIRIKIQNFSFMKLFLKMSSGKWWPFCTDGDELIRYTEAWTHWSTFCRQYFKIIFLNYFNENSCILIHISLKWIPRDSIDINSALAAFYRWWHLTLTHIFLTRAQYTYDDVIKWKHFPRYWPFVRGIHRSPMNSPHKGQWRGALMFSLICARINSWVNNSEAGDLRRHQTHCDVIVM